MNTLGGSGQEYQLKARMDGPQAARPNNLIQQLSFTNDVLSETRVILGRLSEIFYGPRPEQPMKQTNAVATLPNAAEELHEKAHSILEIVRGIDRAITG